MAKRGRGKSRGQAPRRQSSRVHPGPPSAILVPDYAGPRDMTAVSTCSFGVHLELYKFK